MTPPQLQMRRWSLENLPEPDPRVRLAAPDDVPSLARMLTLAFEDEWTEDKVRAELLNHPNVPLTFVAVENGEIAATASLQHKPNFQDAGWVHWVGAHPAHLGKGLGRAAVLAVLHAAREEGRTQSGLTTDDFRLPAIRSYLGLGFEPDPCHPSHEERWREILNNLR